MRLERILVQHLVLVFSDGESLLVALIIVKLLKDFVFLIFCADLLVLDEDAIDLALVYESNVLLVPYLPLSPSFQLLPSLLLNHGCICIHVLPLESDFLELLGESLILILLILLLLADLLIGIPEALLSNGLLLRLQGIKLFLLLLSAEVVLGFPFVTCLLDLGCGVQKLGSLLVLAGQVVLSLLLDILLKLAFVELDALPEFSD